MLHKNLLYVNVVIVLYLLLWLALEAQGAVGSLSADSAATATTCEVQPDGSVMCCELQPDGTELCTSSVSVTLTPFVPTATPTPLPTATPTVTPTPTEIILIPLRPYRAFLPIIR